MRAQLGDPVERRGGQQVQRREVDEGAGRTAAADLHEFGRDLRVYSVAEHGLGYGAVQRGSGHQGRGQRDRLVQQVGQDRVDVGIAAPDGLALRQRDADGAVHGGVLRPRRRPKE